MVLALALTTSLSLTSFVNTAEAQQADGSRVVVLDVARVFKENLEFSQQMDRIRAQADQVKLEIESTQESIRQDAQRLPTLEVGSPARNQLEADLEQRQTALRTKARQQEADLLTTEAQLYYQTYQKMQTVVAQLAQEYNISLVLRFDSAPIDRDNRNDVIVGVNRAVVYHVKLDLTPMVIRAMGPAVASNAAEETRMK